MACVDCARAGSEKPFRASLSYAFIDYVRICQVLEISFDKTKKVQGIFI